MIKETLEKLAAERSENTSEIFKPNDFYGQAYLLKKYCGINQEISLPGIYPHGISIIDKAWANELKHPMPFLLLKSKLQSDVFSKYCDKPSWIIGSPNYYAVQLIEDELKEIQSDAKGTLILPVHSTHHLTNNYDINGFVKYLRGLSEKFEPITICLGWRDIQLKMHEQYLKQGFECTTAGHMYDKEFFFRLVKILAEHKFAITNDIGTSAFHAAAMDLPVILYRQKIETNPAISDQPAYLVQEAKFSHYLPIVERFIETLINPDDQMVQHQKTIAQLILGHEDIKKPDELRNLFESLWQKNEMKPFIKKPNYIAEGSFAEIIEIISKMVKSYPRKTPGRVKIDGTSFTFADLHSFYYQAIQIFKSDLYGFKADNNNPVIVDCGAHIGLASMYFAEKYPKGKIYAYEADPGIAKILDENVKSLGLKNVKTFAKAIWVNDDKILFKNTKDDSGYISNFENGNCVQIPSIRLKNFIEAQKVDLLKLDIEGAEHEVIADCADVLDNVKNIIIEVHKFRDQKGTLRSILSVLEKQNFEYTLGDLHSADWIETQIKPPFDAVKSDKYIITVFAWQKSERPVTYNNEFGRTVDSENEIFERCIQYLNKNDNDNALKFINYAIEKHPDIPTLNYGKAVVFARIGQKQKAMEALRELLENQADHENARILFEALKQENKENKGFEGIRNERIT
jgi:FkbM family methyltransferase